MNRLQNKKKTKNEGKKGKEKKRNTDTTIPLDSIITKTVQVKLNWFPSARHLTSYSTVAKQPIIPDGIDHEKRIKWHPARDSAYSVLTWRGVLNDSYPITDYYRMLITTRMADSL